MPRLVDLVQPTPLEHAIVVGLLREVGEYAGEYAAEDPPITKRVVLYQSWPPQSPRRVLRIHGGWWSLVTRVPRTDIAKDGPTVVIMDGIVDPHDVSTAPGLSGHLETILASAPPEGQRVPDDPDLWFAP